MVYQKEKGDERKFSQPRHFQWCVLHHRQPTMGDWENDKNNHPFIVEHGSLMLIGCQYGGAPTYPVDLRNCMRGVCDSEAALITLARHYSRNGEWYAIEKLEQMGFWGTLVWAHKTFNCSWDLYCLNNYWREIGANYPFLSTAGGDRATMLGVWKYDVGTGEWLCVES